MGRIYGTAVPTGSAGNPGLSPFLITGAPPASASQAALELGGGPFDGVSAGFFGGAVAGTGLAVNLPTGSTADIANLQVGGVSKLKIATGGATGVMTFATGATTAYVVNNTAGKAANLLAGGAGSVFTFDSSGFFAIQGEAKAGVLAADGAGTSYFTVGGTGAIGIVNTLTATYGASDSVVLSGNQIQLRGSTSPTIQVVNTAQTGQIEIASPTGAGAYFSDAAAGDFVLRGTAGTLRIGWGAGASYLRISSATAGALGDGGNLAFGTVTGTQLGTGTTQKLGFYGATPVAQRSGASEAAVATTASTSTVPFGYTTAAQADAIPVLLNEIRATLVALGLFKGSA